MDKGPTFFVKNAFYWFREICTLYAYSWKKITKIALKYVHDSWVFQIIDLSIEKFIVSFHYVFIRSSFSFHKGTYRIMFGPLSDLKHDQFFLCIPKTFFLFCLIFEHLHCEEAPLSSRQFLLTPAYFGPRLWD